MNMRAMYKKILYAGCMLLFLAACTPDTVEMNDYSAPFVTHSPLLVNVNGEVSIADGSRGVKSRVWTFPEGGVVDVKEADGDPRIVFVTFLQPGTFNVHLQTTFNDPAISQLDTTLVITVLDDVDANFISNAPLVGGTRVIEAGQSVTYENNSSGEPNTFMWTFEGATPSSESGEEVTIQYDYPGTWDVTLIAYRMKPYGRDTIQVRNYITVLPSSGGE